MVLGLEQGLGLGLYQVEVLVQDQMDMDQVKNNRSVKIHLALIRIKLHPKS